MADILKPDLCIIGAGASGTSLALAAAERGARVVLVDRGPEPGDGLGLSARRAALMASAERAQQIRTAGRLGLDNGEPKPGFKAIGERAAAIAARLLPRDAEERLKALGIEVVTARPAFTDRRTLSAGDASVRAGNFVLATGTRPVIPSVPGLTEVPFFTPDSILDNLRKLTHLLVIGGGRDAVELAQAYRRLGSAVTLVPQGEILPGFDREMVAIVLQALAEEGVHIRADAEVAAVLPRSQGIGINLALPEGKAETLDVSHILLAMGRLPDFDGDLLAKAGLRMDRDHAERPQLDAWGRSSNPHLWVLAPKDGSADPLDAAEWARLLLDRMLGGGKPAPHGMPRFVGTAPALAQVGQVEAGAPLRPGQTILRAAGVEIEAAHALSESHGFAKLILGPNGALRGGAFVGPAAAELAAMLSMAMMARLKADELADLGLPQASASRLLVELGRLARAERPAATGLGNRLRRLTRR